MLPEPSRRGVVDPAWSRGLIESQPEGNLLESGDRRNGHPVFQLPEFLVQEAEDLISEDLFPIQRLVEVDGPPADVPLRFSFRWMPWQSENEGKNEPSAHGRRIPAAAFPLESDGLGGSLQNPPANCLSFHRGFQVRLQDEGVGTAGWKDEFHIFEGSSSTYLDRDGCTRGEFMECDL